MKDLKIYVLLRGSKKTGKVDTTITALGSAMLEFWGLQNTTKSKMSLIMERDTGKVITAYVGGDNGPKIKTTRRGDVLGTCEEYGISLEMLQAIKDSRFD